MHSDIYWVDAGDLFPGRLATSPRPRGGDWLEDEVAAWRRAGVDHVASLLTPPELRELDIEAEAEECGRHGISFTSVPVEDRDVPTSARAFLEVADRLQAELQAGRSVLVHCRQGIGRASLLAVAILAQAGADGADAFARVGAARGRPVPDTETQREWLLTALATRP